MSWHASTLLVPAPVLMNEIYLLILFTAVRIRFVVCFFHIISSTSSSILSVSAFRFDTLFFWQMCSYVKDVLFCVSSSFFSSFARFINSFFKSLGLSFQWNIFFWNVSIVGIRDHNFERLKQEKGEGFFGEQLSEIAINCHSVCVVCIDCSRLPKDFGFILR